MTHKPRSPREIIEEHFKRSSYAELFEAVYQNGVVPWDKGEPASALVEWAEAQQLDGTGKRALVVGCGLGDDAEYLAARGFDVTAFDVSPTAIAQCKQRWPQSRVTYVTADLFAAPEAWRGAFDFVLESRTIQALAWEYAPRACAAIAQLVKRGGQVLVLCLGREPHEDRRGIPWALCRSDLQAFVDSGLEEVQFDDLHEEPRRNFRVHYRKP